MSKSNTEKTMPFGVDDVAIFNLSGKRYALLRIGDAEPDGSVKQAEKADPKMPEATSESPVEPRTNSTAHYVYGLKGLAELFGCSKATAHNIKKSGLINAAISQIGNTIVVDAAKALDLLKR